MTRERSQITDEIEQGIPPKDKIDEMLRSRGIIPDETKWRYFINQLTLWLGGLALAFSLMFFIAYNWQELGRFAKFGMVEGIIILTIGVYCKYYEHTTASKVWLLVATISLGVLLALFGQTYQTGADPWQLFFNWALLMMPWAIIGRFASLWILWVALINISIILYFHIFQGIFWFGSDSAVWMIFLFNTALLAIWEFFSESWDWLSERWAIQLLATWSGISITWLIMDALLSYEGGNEIASLIWLIWLAVIYYVYRIRNIDLFILAGSCLSIITIVVSFLGKLILDDALGFFFLALVVIGMGSTAAIWLKNIHAELHL